MRPIHTTAFLLMILAGITGCSKMLDVTPPGNELTGEQVFSNDQSAIQAVVGIYSRVMQNFGFLNGFMTRYAGLYSDELNRAISPTVDQVFYSNELPVDEKNVWAIWKDGYQYILLANTAVEGLEKATSVSSPLKEQLIGEAKFLRALSYFYLVNLFGDVPLVLTSDYEQSMNIPRIAVPVVYDQMVEDLRAAEKQLPLISAGDETMPFRRIRAGKKAASALLARVCLYKEDWPGAEAAADSVIAAGMYRLSENLPDVFPATSTEVILQFMPVQKDYNTAEGGFFLLPTSSGNPVYQLTQTLADAFEAGDKRKEQWTKTVMVNGKQQYIPYKQRIYQATPCQEYNMVLRLAEQFLIRAEARANQGKLTSALMDLNTIRRRANLPAITGSPTKTEILAAIEKERRIEFFVEWGHRYFDLKRLGRADNVLGATKTGWQPHDKLWPIPKFEIDRNGNLIQNQGYTP